jgi:mRNA interferase MazF
MKIKRGSICLVNLNPVRGHEQAGSRPCLVTSVDRLNNGPAGLLIVLPITTAERGIPAHIEILPPEGGLNYKSFAMCEMVRSISKERIIKSIGIVSDDTMIQVEKNLKQLLGFSS